jgi:hypothetical protein
MAKHVANLGKGSTPPSHVGRETVPHDMGANVARWWLQLGPLETSILANFPPLARASLS